MNEKTMLLDLTAKLVGAYVSNNPMPSDDLPELIASVNSSLNSLGAPPAEDAPVLVPAVNPKRSVQPDYVVCLEDGKRFKSLKRHLMTHHSLTPEEYRMKWGLSPDHPMVAPNYAATRSALAKEMGLGRKPGTKVTATRQRRKRA